MSQGYSLKGNDKIGVICTRNNPVIHFDIAIPAENRKIMMYCSEAITPRHQSQISSGTATVEYHDDQSTRYLAA